MTAPLDRHRELKAAILDRLRELASIARVAGMRTLASDIETTRIPKIEQERFHLVVLGEFNHGKSTFVNALLGAPVLPTGITPTTAAINHVVWAERPRAGVTLLDGTVKEVPPDDVASWVTVAGKRSRDVAFVEVGYPAEILRNNVTLVDTPGVNDLNEQRADVTYGYVPRADAVIFLLDAGQALKDSEREFLSSRVLERSRSRLVFVLGKTDLLDERDRTDVLAYVRTNLAKMLPEPVVFPLSAKQALAGQTDASGLPALLEYLDRFLATDRSRTLLDNAAADGMRTAAYLEQNLGLKQRAYELDVTELEERIGKVRGQLDSTKRQLDELHGRIDAEAAAIKAQIHLDTQEFARRFIDALPGQIDAVDADDVKRYLPGFIEDRFREWAEGEGERIASLLERLAEDVIAVTNENVHTASAALAERLGRGDAPVPIEVDSFKYDLGIYAVGALGTTVLLFVNTLAGGLLTLAAPILAIVLKSKVAGDIREQAKERAPDAVRHAADAMRPHFDRCIDEFATRLSDFVTSAGTTLFKGISEVLDQTMADRRSRAGEVEELRVALAAQLAAVGAAQAALVAVRAAVWSSDGPTD